MELTVLQITIVGLVVSGLAAVIRLLVARFSGVVLSRGWISIVAYVVSFLLAVAFSYQSFPSLSGDPAVIVTALVGYASAVFGLATLIYNLLLAKLLEALGISAEKLFIKYAKQSAGSAVGGNLFRG